ncbi:MAG: glycosyltransferase [Candidatus Helarchaeota archaeon]
MDRYPPISIIVPIRNRKDMVPRLINSLLNVDYPTFEIIMVDDASTDGTPELIEKFPVKLIKLHQSLGPASARNTGIRHAKYTIIALTDSDCMVSPNWLKELSPFLKDYDIVGGYVKFRDYAEHRITPLSHLTSKTEIRINSDINFINTSNMLFAKSLWQSLGGFRNYRLEDVDFTWRALKAGFRVYYIPKGIVIHDNPTHFIQKFKRLRQYGECYADLIRIHGIKLRYQRPTSKYHSDLIRPSILLCSPIVIIWLFLFFYCISPLLLICGIICLTSLQIYKFFSYKRRLGWKFIFMLNIMKTFIVLFSLINFLREK